MFSLQKAKKLQPSSVLLIKGQAYWHFFWVVEFWMCVQWKQYSFCISTPHGYHVSRKHSGISHRIVCRKILLSTKEPKQNSSTDLLFQLRVQGNHCGPNLGFDSLKKPLRHKWHTADSCSGSLNFLDRFWPFIRSFPLWEKLSELFLLVASDINYSIILFFYFSVNRRLMDFFFPQQRHIVPIFYSDNFKWWLNSIFKGPFIDSRLSV